MRALTIRQPWADLIMSGAKTVENRTWAVPSTLPQRWRCRMCRSEWRSGFRGSSIDPADGCPQGCSRMKDPDLLGPFPFRLGIHAAKRSEPNGHPAWTTWVGNMASGLAGADERGALLGTVEVTGCHHADECYDREVCPTSGCTFDDHETERWCSRWAEPGCWHWTLTDPQPLDAPIPIRGRQGLWRLPEEVR